MNGKISIEYLESKGYKVSEQLKKVLEYFDDFPVEHFSSWVEEQRKQLGGAILQEYLCTGIVKRNK